MEKELIMKVSDTLEVTEQVNVYGFEIHLSKEQAKQIKDESGVSPATLSRAMKSDSKRSYGEYYVRRRALELGGRKMIEIPTKKDNHA